MNLSLLLRFYRPNCSYTITAEQELIWQDQTPAPTQEQIKLWELSYQSDIAKNQCKTQAKALLLESDWSETPSAQMDLANGGSWIVYRRELRQLFVNPIENPTWPTKPEAKWKV